MSQREEIVPGDLIAVAPRAFTYNSLEAFGDEVILRELRPQAHDRHISLVLAVITDEPTALYVCSLAGSFWVRQLWVTRL